MNAAQFQQLGIEGFGRHAGLVSLILAERET